MHLQKGIQHKQLINNAFRLYVCIKKNFFLTFSKKIHLFLELFGFKHCWLAALIPLGGRMRPAGRVFEVPGLGFWLG